MTSAKRTVPLGAVLILSVALLTSVAVAEGKTKTKTFSSGNLGLQIPEPVGIESFPISSAIRVKTKGRIKDVNVSVRITIPDDRDLELAVFGPTFKGSNLKNNGFLNSPKGPDFGAGPASCAGTPTVFDSQAPISILDGAPPFVGSFRPETTLDGLRGGRLQGKWSLEVMDLFRGNIDGSPGSPGVLDCWKLTVRYKPAKRK
jgi:subtilisin-like proprotein convertase family protein